LRIAADTMLPAGIVTETPLITTVTVSGMRRLLCHARGQVRRHWDGSVSVHDLRNEEFGRAERRCDTQAFVSGGQVKSFVLDVWANQRKLVGRRCAKACPRS
jgi:hypothetical protein